MQKDCPICGSDTWDYDVVNGQDRFCGGCHDKLMKYAAEQGLVKYNAKYHCLMFENRTDYYQALADLTIV